MIPSAGPGGRGLEGYRPDAPPLPERTISAVSLQFREKDKHENNRGKNEKAFTEVSLKSSRATLIVALFAVSCGPTRFIHTRPI